MVRVCELYAPLVDATVKEVVEGSGRCTAKSTSNEIVALTLMMQSKFNNIWYCRAERSDIRDTIFSSMISTAQIMGVDIAVAQEQLNLERAVENIGIQQANIRAGAGGDRSGRGTY